MGKSPISRITAQSKAELKKRKRPMGMRKRLAMDGSNEKTVPGPSTNPATNILIVDIATRAGARLLRLGIEKNLLKTRYSKEERRAIMDERSLGETISSALIARIATRSLPGMLLVGGGLTAKALLDRSLSRRRAAREGDEKLLGDKKKR